MQNIFAAQNSYLGNLDISNLHLATSTITSETLKDRNPLLKSHPFDVLQYGQKVWEASLILQNWFCKGINLTACESREILSHIRKCKAGKSLTNATNAMWQCIYASIKHIKEKVEYKTMHRQGPQLTWKMSLPAASGLGNQTRQCIVRLSRGCLKCFINSSTQLPFCHQFVSDHNTSTFPSFLSQFWFLFTRWLPSAPWWQPKSVNTSTNTIFSSEKFAPKRQKVKTPKTSLKMLKGSAKRPK